MRLLAMMLAISTLAACTGGSSRHQAPEPDQGRKLPPSGSGPQITVSGHATIGVSKTF